MAQLLPESFVPKTKIYFNASPKEWQAQMDAEWQEISAKGLGVIKFHRGDGYAIYIVRSLKPLKLQHVHCGDAWTVDYALIRGLRLADVVQRLEPNADGVKSLKALGYKPRPTLKALFGGA